MKTIEQIAAEILVERGYAKSFSNEQWLIMDGIGNKFNGLPYEQAVTPFADTLEGRRQADAVEDWLFEYGGTLWAKSFFKIDEPIPTKKTGKTFHQWRLYRIKWCLEQLMSERTANTAPQTD